MLLKTLLISALCLIAFFALARMFCAVCNEYAHNLALERTFLDIDDPCQAEIEADMSKTKAAFLIAKKIAIVFAVLFYVDAIIAFVAAIALIVKMF